MSGPSLYSILLSLGALALASPGCTSKPAEPAPLEGGERLDLRIHRTAGVAQGSITVERTEDGFRLVASAPAYPPIEVGPDLRDGRRPLRMFDVGMLWLPPSERTVGAKNHLGDVVAKERKGRWETFVLSERNGAIKRFFDVDTGFVVAIDMHQTGGRIELVGSTVPGL